MTSRKVETRFKHRVPGTIAMAALATAGTSAHAQETPPPVQEVVVTGSRIASPNATSTSPIQVVTTDDIQLGGRADISDVLMQLPQVYNNMMGQDLGNRSSGLTTAGGVATANLRGVGPNRTLVLVNGRRLGAGSPNTAIQSPAPDLDQIPAALVDRVDVITGGASATYGSDAIRASSTSCSRGISKASRSTISSARTGTTTATGRRASCWPTADSTRSPVIRTTGAINR